MIFYIYLILSYIGTLFFLFLDEKREYEKRKRRGESYSMSLGSFLGYLFALVVAPLAFPLLGLNWLSDNAEDIKIFKIKIGEG